MATTQLTLTEKCYLYHYETKGLSARPSQEQFFDDFMKKDDIEKSHIINIKLPKMLATESAYRKKKAYRQYKSGVLKSKEDIVGSGVIVWNRDQTVKYIDKDGNVKFQGQHSLPTDANETDADFTQDTPPVKNAPLSARSKASKSTKMQVKKEISFDESYKEDFVRKSALKSSRKRSIIIFERQEDGTVTRRRVEEASIEGQQENFDPTASRLQDSSKEPCPKRICIENEEDVVSKRIANIKTEIDDDIIFEGIVVQEKKKVDFSRIFPCRPTILGGMNMCEYEELVEEEEAIRNIHTLGFFHCMKEFLERVFGITNDKAIEMKVNLSSLIQKAEVDPNFKAMDVSMLRGVLDDNVGRLAVQATKERAVKHLDFLSVLEALEKSCKTRMTPELLKEVTEVIESQTDCSEDAEEIISADSILEFIRRVMLDVNVLM